MRTGKRYLILVVVSIALFCVSFSPLRAAGQEKEPLTEAEMPVPRREMPNYVLEQLRKDPFVKEHLGWKLAIGQHPMYLLIDEDRGEPKVGERVPPWGASTKEEYVKRVRRNLKSLENLPDLRINYQWSAVELDSMCESFPDIHAWMTRLYNQGSLDFVDGTYSQAHLQVLSSESNWRQFEYGHEVYEKLFGKHVDVYSRQETGYHLQVPQLLRKFGYQFATLPAFHAVLEVIEGPLELIAQEGIYEAATGDEFVNAVALDGSMLPFYLQLSLGWGSIREARELQQDLYSTPKIQSVFPDMDEVERGTFEEYYSLFDWVLLRDALIQRCKANPPRAKARVFSYWSYIEGVWAEELMRTMRAAEEAALLAEQVYCMGRLAGLKMDKSAELKDIWKAILKSQHHDISWIEVTDLRRKSINRLKKTISRSEAIMKEVAEKLVNRDNGFMAVFNGLPRGRRAPVRLTGNRTLGEGAGFQQFRAQSIGFADLPAGGFASYGVHDEALPSIEKPMPNEVSAEHYTVRLSESGLMEQISTDDGMNLLQPGEYLGGEIRARIEKEWVDNRAAECSYYTGPVCDILERTASLGHIPVSERYYFFKETPAIKVELAFDFDGNEVGYMWIDETKINVYYPTVGSDVYQDIPFGYVQARAERPLFPANWLYCGGLVYANRGTVKHWVKDGVIANVLGWGSNHFSNRLHWDWLESAQYDIRLYGKQKLEYWLLPFGEFDGNRIVQEVNALTSPVFVCEGAGGESFYEIEDDDLAATSVYEEDGQIWARGYKMPFNATSAYRDWEIFTAPVVEASE